MTLYADIISSYKAQTNRINHLQPTKPVPASG